MKDVSVGQMKFKLLGSIVVFFKGGGVIMLFQMAKVKASFAASLG
jgi:hypothetical protein